MILWSIFNFSNNLQNGEIVEKLVNFGDFENQVGKEVLAVGFVSKGFVIILSVNKNV